jgi:transposase
MPRTCTICRHAKRREIEADVQAGLSYRDIARRHNISKDVICRHRANHVSQRSATALATVRKIEALLDQAETSATWNASLLMVHRARGFAKELLTQL